MNLYDRLHYNNVNFTDVPPALFLLGLLSAFDNRYQAKADAVYKEISWKQFFAIVCIKLLNKSPTINELSTIMGSSHQNVKQILLKLEKKGFVNIVVDEADKRKQRIELTNKVMVFAKEHEQLSTYAVQKIFKGISDEQLMGTIQTIIQMDNNLKDLQEEE